MNVAVYMFCFQLGKTWQQQPEKASSRAQTPGDTALTLSLHRAEHKAPDQGGRATPRAALQRLLCRPRGCPLVATGCPEQPAPEPGPADTFTAPACLQVAPPPLESKSHLVTQVNLLICKRVTLVTHQRKSKQDSYQRKLQSSVALESAGHTI